MSTSTPHSDAPNYDLEIDADDLLESLAALAADYASDHAEKDCWWRESLDMATEHTEARYWALEALGGRHAVAATMVELQGQTKHGRAGRYRNADGTVDVRGFMASVSRLGDEAHERAQGPYAETRQADEAETAYSKVLSLLRDEYGVGWPRMGEHGNPLECDLP